MTKKSQRWITEARQLLSRASDMLIQSGDADGPRPTPGEILSLAMELNSFCYSTHLDFPFDKEALQSRRKDVGP